MLSLISKRLFPQRLVLGCLLFLLKLLDEAEDCLFILFDDEGSYAFIDLSGREVIQRIPRVNVLRGVANIKLRIFKVLCPRSDASFTNFLVLKGIESVLLFRIIL